LQLGGTGIVWSVVLGATALAISLSVFRIAAEFGLPHANQLLASLRTAPQPVALTACPHCGTTHAQ
jgi:hypothetical protein